MDRNPGYDSGFASTEDQLYSDEVIERFYAFYSTIRHL